MASHALSKTLKFTCERFVGAQEVAHRFYDVARELGPKLGPVLIQCGPDLAPSERDALEDELATIARAKGHDRHWARSFFRTRRVRPPKNDANDGGGGTT